MRTTMVINKTLATDAAIMTGSISSFETFVDEPEEDDEEGIDDPPRKMDRVADAAKAEFCELAVTREKETEEKDWPIGGRYTELIPKYNWDQI